MKYLKKFLTETEYNTYTADTTNFIKPNVSLITESNSVAYHPYDPYNGHAYVEIGGLKWATMNVGATGITDAGLYFQWGDTQGYTASQVGSGEGQKGFRWKDYKFGDYTSSSGMTKYTPNDGKSVLELSDDAARVNWGGEWRVPTNEEIVAFGNAVDAEWNASYQGSGVAGLVCTDKNDSSKVLFFPAGGNCKSDKRTAFNSYGYYWSGSLNIEYNPNYGQADNFNFRSGRANWGNNASSRDSGYSIRPVAY